MELNLPYFQKIAELGKPLNSVPAPTAPAAVLAKDFEETLEVPSELPPISWPAEPAPLVQTEVRPRPQIQELAIHGTLSSMIPVQGAQVFSSEEKAEAVTLASPSNSFAIPTPVVPNDFPVPVAPTDSVTPRSQVVGTEVPPTVIETTIIETPVPGREPMTVQDFFQQHFAPQDSNPQAGTPEAKRPAPEIHEIHHFSSQTPVVFSVEQTQVLQQYIQWVIEQRDPPAGASEPSRKTEFMQPAEPPRAPAWRGWSSPTTFPATSRMRIP